MPWEAKLRPRLERGREHTVPMVPEREAVSNAAQLSTHAAGCLRNRVVVADPFRPEFAVLELGCRRKE